MNLFLRLFRDEAGFVLPAEAIVLGTVGVVGATVGLTAMARSMNDELAESSFAIRSIDQSFQIEGDSRCGACIAGSKFTQQPVEESLKQLREQYEKDKAQKLKEQDEDQKKTEESAEKEDQPSKAPKSRKHKKNKKPKDQDEDLDILQQQEPAKDAALNI